MKIYKISTKSRFNFDKDLLFFLFGDIEFKCSEVFFKIVTESEKIVTESGSFESTTFYFNISNLFEQYFLLYCTLGSFSISNDIFTDYSFKTFSTPLN